METNGKIDKQTWKLMEKQTNRHRNQGTNEQIDIETNGKIDKQTWKLRDKQTNRHRN